MAFEKMILTQIKPMSPFGTPWKHQKTLRFSDDFRGSLKGILAQYELRMMTILVCKKVEIKRKSTATVLISKKVIVTSTLLKDIRKTLNGKGFN